MARARRSRSPAPILIPGLLAVLFIGAAVAVGILNRQEAASLPEPKEDRGTPFADLPPDIPPGRRGDAAASTLPPAPAGLKAQAVWIEAVVTAGEAEVLFEEARVAKRDGHVTLANEKGRAAREKFNAAVEATAPWEQQLIEAHGESDPQVREIMSERSRWFERLDWLLKSIAR